MSEHVPHDLLDAFVEGDVSEHVAVHIAEHLDRCPGCATLAASLEPLHPAFASMDDPPIPEDMVRAVLDAVNADEPAPFVELAVGGTLLACAGLLAFATQHPITALADLSAVARASQALVVGLAAGLGSSATVAATATLLTGFAGVATLRLAPREA